MGVAEQLVHKLFPEATEQRWEYGVFVDDGEPWLAYHFHVVGDLEELMQRYFQLTRERAPRIPWPQSTRIGFDFVFE